MLKTSKEAVLDLGKPRDQAWASPKIEQREGDIGFGVVALEEIAAGEVLVALADVYVSEPTRFTIQFDSELHQDGTGEIDDYINHGCEPNVRMDVERRCFVALRAIAAGEQLSFNYLTTEWDMAEAFECRCGSSRCVRMVRGFKHLSPAQQEELGPLLSAYLRGMALVSLSNVA